MQTLLDATDTPKMLERLEAYKKFVDHEKEGLKRDLEASYAKDKDKLAQYEIWLDDMVSLFFELTPYVAQQDRKTLIERHGSVPSPN